MMPKAIRQELTAQPPGADGNQSLARGLHMLRILVDDGPQTATEIAARMGLHQSSVSRSLSTLIAAGYVRKSEDGRFECSFGILGLADSLGRMPLIRQLRAGVENIINNYSDITIAICMLWQHDVLHLLRARSGSLFLPVWHGGFPLNVSTPGLRLLLDLPDNESITILERSREQLGWGGRPEIVPDSAAQTLTLARQRTADEVLLIDGWWRPNHATGAILIKTPEPQPVALAVVDEAGGMDPTAHTLLLHRIRRDLELELLSHVQG